MRVAVPFGKKKVYTAIVHSIHQQKPLVYDTKEIIQIIDKQAIVTLIQLQFWQWIANYYMCTIGEVMRAALPAALMLESETLIVKNNAFSLNESTLEDDEYLILEALSTEYALKISDVIKILNKDRVISIINNMVNKGAINLKEELFQKYKPKLIKYIRLSAAYKSETALKQLLEQLQRANKQREALLTLFSLEAKWPNKPIKAKALENIEKISLHAVKTLIEKEIFEVYYLETERLQHTPVTTIKTKSLTEEQQAAYEAIISNFKLNRVVLLHGVTASGKTEIYTKLIEGALKKGKQVLYLLPEIALTTQLVSRLKQYFGNKLIVYHSRYNNNERVEVWYKVLGQSQKAQVIIGARSAVLLPFRDLGLIIIDEEHEQSYKQFEPAPRYHARDVAIVLAQHFKAKVLLGSATPSLESYYNANNGKYALVTLNKRYNHIKLPLIDLINLAEQYKRKRMRGHFSNPLITEISTTLNEGFQVILFQNRRGFSPVVECLSCGHSPQCPNCDVSLTYHQYKNQLRCHYCGYHMEMYKNCTACGNATLDTKGFGTEQIEAEAKVLFPKFKTARMDLDTTRGKYSFEKLINNFEQGEINILVGTQMITKGLNFKNVKLVGIMNADNLWNFPDYRAQERSYQQMVQVAGRAGRTDQQGKVLIQTYNPNHPILKYVTQNAYKAMYQSQLKDRHTFQYAPIYKSIKITFKHKNYNKVNETSNWFAVALKQIFTKQILGPESPPVARIKNQYIKNVLLKIKPNQSLSKTKAQILKIENSFNAIAKFRPVKIIFNVDY